MKILNYARLEYLRMIHYSLLEDEWYQETHGVMDVSYTGFYSPIYQKENGCTLQFTICADKLFINSVLVLIRGENIFENFRVTLPIFSPIRKAIKIMKKRYKIEMENKRVLGVLNGIDSKNRN